MRIYDYAKELTKITGRQVSPNEIIRILSKKKDGLRMTDDISAELMEYVKPRVTGQIPDTKPVRKPGTKLAAKSDSPAGRPKTDKKPAGSRSNSNRTKPAAGTGKVVALRPKTKPAGKSEVKHEEKTVQEEKTVEAVKVAVEDTVKEAKAPKAVKTPVAEETSNAAPASQVAEAVEATSSETAPVTEVKAAQEPEAPATEDVKAEAVNAEKQSEKQEAAPETETVEEPKPVKKENVYDNMPVRPESKGRKETAGRTRTQRGSEKSSDRPARGEKTDRPARGERGDRPARAERGDRPARDDRNPKSRRDDKGDETRVQRTRSVKTEAADAPVDAKKRSSRKGDKSRDKEKEDRRENRETKNRREDKRSKRNAFNEDSDMGERRKKPAKKQEKKEEETIKTVVLPETLTLGEFAAKIKQPVNALIKKLFLEGKMYTVNTDISYEEAELIALEYNIICEQEVKIDIVEEALRDIEDPEESLVTRPPVVCVMGHVDHGKTSLLDAIRKTSVTEGEAGGITQHIGAYTVNVNDRKITFLDTPGHEAFTAMRLRGAMATDIAILVVAADDGVMPQTVEAINHAKAAGIEIIVAVNKIDKPSANVERVKQELVEYGLIAEDWGGSTIFCPVSAHSHEGIDNLLDMIILTSDILELKANPNRKARGVVIEAKLDRGRGAVATLLVQKGTLKVGDFIAIGESHGRVRAMTDDKQKSLKEATPSTPVEVIGLSTVPNTGEVFIATDNEKEARNISNAFITKGKESLIAETKAKMSLDDIFSQMKEGTLKELNIIIKADVQGSVEALKQSLIKLSNEEIVIKCIHSGVGAINESDVSLAAASDAIIIGFNVRPEPMAKQLADSEKVDVRLYNVIYNAIDDIESAMKGMLDPIFEEKIIGHAVIRQTFKASGIGTIAGTFVEDGVVERNASARISRGKDLIWEGKIASLKRFNDDAKEVKAGYECGIVFTDFNDVREDDTIEVYKMVEVPRD